MSTGIFDVYPDYRISLTMKVNFDSIFKSIQLTLNMWKYRSVMLLGKIQIVKTFVIPKFISKDLINEINKLTNEFIWGGKDKNKRS